MEQQRHISRVVTVPPLASGFVGPGHVAAPVLSPEDFAVNDPFILLMDDHLDIGDRRIGGPHPHAGFETVTLILDGEVYDRDEGGVLKAGEAQWMTAGRESFMAKTCTPRGGFACSSCGWCCLKPSVGPSPVFKSFTLTRFQSGVSQVLKSASIAAHPAGFDRAPRTTFRSRSPK